MMILGCKRVSFQLVKLNRRVKMVVLKNSRRLYLKKIELCFEKFTQSDVQTRTNFSLQFIFSFTPVQK